MRLSSGQAVNDGDYDYLVTTPDLDLNNPACARTSPERGWVRADPAVEQVRPLRPCRGLPA